MSFEDLSDDTVLAFEHERPADKSSLAIRDDIARVESGLAEFDKISAGLADLETRFPSDLAYDVSTTKGMTEAIAHRAAWREPRINVEKLRKAAKAPVLALGKNIDARAAWLTQRLLDGEQPIDLQIKAEEARKEAVKQAKIDAEFARSMAIQETIADIHTDAAAAAGRPSAEIAVALAAMRERTLDEKVFQELFAQAKAAKDAAIARLEQALKAKLHEEAEAARLTAEREELAALRKQAAEQKAKDDALALAARIEADRLAAAERAAAKAEQARLDAEAVAARAEADRLAAEARAAAKAEHDAAMRAEKDAAAALRQAQEAQQAAQLAADTKLRDAAPQLLSALRAAVAGQDDWRELADSAIKAAA